jgi:hypothetical protein
MSGDPNRQKISVHARFTTASSTITARRWSTATHFLLVEIAGIPCTSGDQIRRATVDRGTSSGRSGCR